jgi:hypothetical protein
VVAAVLCWQRVCIVGYIVLFVGGECRWSANARPHLICLAVCPEGPAPVAAGTHTEIAESHQPLLAPRIVMEGDGPWVLR